MNDGFDRCICTQAILLHWVLSIRFHCIDTRYSTLFSNLTGNTLNIIIAPPRDTSVVGHRVLGLQAQWIPVIESEPQYRTKKLKHTYIAGKNIVVVNSPKDSISSVLDAVERKIVSSSIHPNIHSMAYVWLAVTGSSLIVQV